MTGDKQGKINDGKKFPIKFVIFWTDGSSMD